MGALALAGLLGLQGCGRMEEEALRAHLAQWFALGETVAFAAQSDCAAATFRLVDTQMTSALGVVRAAPRMAQVLRTRGVVALDNPDEAPDAGMVALANADRDLGYRLRRAALEGRICMDDFSESAFRYALDNPRAVLGFDDETSGLMLMDPDTGVLIFAMGEGA